MPDDSALVEFQILELESEQGPRACIASGCFRPVRWILEPMHSRDQPYAIKLCELHWADFCATVKTVEPTNDEAN